MTRFAALLACAGLGATVALGPESEAGPPMICWPIEIGDHESLPWGSDPFAVKKDYDLERLVPDTMRLLDREVPVLVHLETLRRATIYGSPHGKGGGRGRAATWELTARILARVLDEEAAGRPADRWWLLAGYLVGACAQADIDTGLRGYPWAAAKAKTLLDADAEAHFALALMTAMGEANAEEHERHLRAALAGAEEGSLLAKNLLLTFGRGATTLDDLRARHAKKGG